MTSTSSVTKFQSKIHLDSIQHRGSGRLSKEEEELHRIYKQAMRRIDELVEEVFKICDDVADTNHYEKDWVLDRFREKFNKARRTSK